MDRFRFVEFVIRTVGFLRKIIPEEVEPLQHISLLDEDGTQDPIPTPFLVDRTLLLAQIIHRKLLLVHKAVLLQSDFGTFQLRQVHLVGNLGPRLKRRCFGNRVFRSQPGPVARMLRFEPLGDFKRIPHAPRRKVIGVPIVVDVVLVFIGTGYAQDDVSVLIS